MTPQDHLGDLEFVDLIDGTLPAARMQHLDQCPACRAKADELSTAMMAAAADEVPEPSPVFWDQLSARVRNAVSDEPPQPGVVWQALQPTRFRWAALATAAVLVLAVGLLRPTTVFRSSSGQNTAANAPGDSGEVLADDDTFGDIDMDEGWALVRTFADELPADEIDAAGVAAHPGSAEGVALRMSDSERRELVRLLEDEIKRPPTADSGS